MFSLLAREKPNQTGIRLPATCIIFLCENDNVFDPRDVA